MGEFDRGAFEAAHTYTHFSKNEFELILIASSVWKNICCPDGEGIRGLRLAYKYLNHKNYLRS